MMLSHISKPVSYERSNVPASLPAPKKDYIPRTPANRPLLIMMTKVRANQSLGAALSKKGNLSRVIDLYNKTIQVMIAENVKPFLPAELIKLCEDALEKFKGADNDEAKAWILRSAIDGFYDKCVKLHTTVPAANFIPIHSRIKQTINKVSPLVEAGKHKEGMKDYLSLLKEAAAMREFQDFSDDTKNMVQMAIAAAENADDAEVIMKTMRESLDQVYNEVRLPDNYTPCVGPSRAVANLHPKFLKNSTLTVDFRQDGESIFSYHLQHVSDKCMGGNSEADVILAATNGVDYASFSGSVVRYNLGGFASFRIIPDDKAELQSLLRGCTGFLLEVKNLHSSNCRYKFQLANETHMKAFNWQSSFYVEPGKPFQTIYLDLKSFWPTLFGHVLHGPGNVELSKVDCFGFVISHVTVDGKKNPDFVEGKFGLGIRSIKIVKDPDSATSEENGNR